MANRKRPRVNWGFIVVVSVLAAAAVLVTLGQPMGFEGVPSWDEILAEPAYPAQGKEQDAQSRAPEQDEISVHILDVGQGDAVLIQTTAKNILIDAGPADAADKVVAYLRGQGVRELDLVIATHPHADHIGGMAQVMRRFSVADIVMPQIPEKLGASGYSYEKLLEAVAAKGLRITRPRPGDTYDLGGATLTILGPVAEDTTNMNNNSVVARLDYGTTSFLFTGDGEAEEEESLLQAGAELSADVLKAGHHGSKTSSTGEFLQAVNPRWAAISCGWENSYGHPHSTVLRSLEGLGAAVWRTDLDGSVVFYSNGEDITVSAEKTKELAA